MEQFFELIMKYAELIYPYVVALLPSITAIATCVISVVKICQSFKALRQEVKDKTDIKEARAEMRQIISENRALRKRLDTLISIEGKVKQYDTDKEV